MNLTHPSEVRALLAEMDFKPSKSLGQNFLIDANIVQILLDAADIQSHETALEIGPGLGVLTAPIAERAAHLTAVEKDARLFARLQSALSAPNITLLNRDALDLDAPAYDADKMISNLPYSVGSRILMDAFAAITGPARIVVTVQLEVADRLVAKPDTKDYGLLTIAAQIRYAARRHKVVSPTCFFPPPAVKSAIVVLDRIPSPAPSALARKVRSLAARAFAHRRKQLGNILDADALTCAGIDPTLRPENLAPPTWLALAGALTD